MISSKKVLSIMATMVTCYITMPIQTYAMEDDYGSKNYNNNNIINETDKENSYDLLCFSDGEFFESIYDVMQDITKQGKIYYIKDKKSYILIYECKLLGAECDQSMSAYVSKEYSYIKYDFEHMLLGCLEFMLNELRESSGGNILLFSKEKRVYWNPSAMQNKFSFIDNTLNSAPKKNKFEFKRQNAKDLNDLKLNLNCCSEEKTQNYLKKFVDDYLCEYNYAILSEIEDVELKEMDQILADLIPDCNNSFELNFIEKTQKSGKK